MPDMMPSSCSSAIASNSACCRFHQAVLSGMMLGIADGVNSNNGNGIPSSVPSSTSVSSLEQQGRHGGNDHQDSSLDGLMQSRMANGRELAISRVLSGSQVEGTLYK